MGLRSRILGFLARGDPGEADPDALVELEVVPLSIGPLRVAALTREGIRASGIESVNIITKTRTDMRVMVHGADVAAARETLKRVFDDDGQG